MISESAESIKISENSFKYIHKQLLNYSSKDQWHRRDYKQHNNSVEASFPDRTAQIISETRLSPREKSILAFLSDHPGSKSGALAARLNIPNPTVKRILKDLLTVNLIEVMMLGLELTIQ